MLLKLINMAFLKEIVWIGSWFEVGCQDRRLFKLN
ncbi:uncharacterized protein METZ01_LOCUS82341 [marine metagenome]|uniref:Uncharacterized protein n=1 Tax=marine metagenome TaxID=408172 RepID=A0A381UQ80_9ZZZZ